MQTKMLTMQLLQTQAHLQLVNFLEQATPDALEKLNFNEFDIQHFNLIFMNDFKRGKSLTRFRFEQFKSF